MNPQQFAKENLILKVTTGSHLYGTNTENSDKDYVGICIPPEDFIIGLYTFDQYKEDTKKSNEQRRNTKDDTDFTIYSLKKYVMLAKENNPNILEILFTPEKNIDFWNSYGVGLLEHRHLFPSQKCYFTMKGYAFSQKQKLITKRERLEAFREALINLKSLDTDGFPVLKERLVIGKTDSPWKTFEKGSVICGVIGEIGDLLSEYGQRVEYITKYGYDVKFASHLMRLLYEAKEMLETGGLMFPLENSKHILDIKTGKYTLDEVLSQADDLEKQVDESFKHTKLPHSADLGKINSFLVRMLKDYWSQKEVTSKI